MCLFLQKRSENERSEPETAEQPGRSGRLPAVYEMENKGKYCPRCGAESGVQDAFCRSCGAPLENAAERVSPKIETAVSAGKKKMVIGICAAVLAVLLVCGILFTAGVFGNGAKDGDGQTKPGAEADADIQNASQTSGEELEIQLTQADTHEYPEVELYFRLCDLQGNDISELKNGRMEITEENGKTVQAEVKSLQAVQKNICFVMDISASMKEYSKYLYGRDAILHLLSRMEQQDNYQAALISFNSTQNTLEDFTDSYDGIRSELNSISPSGQTAFWDSLEHALLCTNSQKGQKCIVAATDGMDNASQTTRENVIALAQELQIPIYIITFDGSLMSDLNDVASATGGRCFAADQPQDVQSIYDSILQVQQNQFTVKFTSDGDTDSSERKIRLLLTADGYRAEATAEYHRVEELYAEQISNDIISEVSASSYLQEYYESTGHLVHRPENVIDGSYRTAWVEDASGDGIGEWLKISFDRTYSINGVSVSNGYKKSSDLYRKNSRAEKIRLHFSDGSHRDYTLKDVFEGEQRIVFDKPVITNYLRLEILSVYPGTKYQDTCITELQVF